MNHKKQTYGWLMAVLVTALLAAVLIGLCFGSTPLNIAQVLTGLFHPGGDGVEYTVNICKGANPITEGIEDFTVCSEHYYLHVAPAIEVLATTRFPLQTYYHAANKPIDMPVVWTKYWGLGRVFYNSLGHHDDVFDRSPAAERLMERGMLWAAGGKEYAGAHGLSREKYENNAKMY